MADATYTPKVYRQQGGARLVVASSGSLDVESGGEIDIESGGSFKIAGTAVTASAAELNKTDNLSATTTELNFLAGVTAGTATASKAAVLGANKNLDTLVIAASGLKIGSSNGTAVTATAAELNYNAGVTAGTATASKAAVLGANKNIDTIVIAASGLKIGSSNGTAVTATAAELNFNAGVSAGTATASKAAVLGANKNLDTLVLADGGLKLGSSNGTAVTATAAELNKLDGRALSATITIGAESANVVNALVQLQDANAADIARRSIVDLYLTTSTGGDSLAASPSGGFAIGTDGLILGFHTTGRSARVVSESDGDIDINVTETGASATKRLAVVLPNGDIVVSTGIMTFTTA